MNSNNIKNDIQRCITCLHKPCQKACPAEIDIPAMIYAAKEKDYSKAREIILNSSNLSTICSRVCPHDRQCEGSCTLGIKMTPIKIGNIESFISDQLVNNEDLSNDINIDCRIGIVGGGPAGISAAKDLLKAGYRVNIYDAHEKLGGVIRYGIPNFRINDELVDQEVNSILNHPNAQFYPSCIAGKDISAEQLLQDNDALIIAAGLNKPKKLGLDNEDNLAVITSDEYLAFANGFYSDAPFKDLVMNPDNHVLVVGGGDVAMDAARASKELGLKQTEIIYRRDFDQMPANKEELEDTLNNYHVKFNNLCNPTKLIIEDDRLVGVECIKMELVEDINGGRKKPVAIEGSEFIKQCDILVLSLGMDMSDNLKTLFNELGVEVDWKFDALTTSNPKVFVAGDIKQGDQTVVKAMRDGKEVAKKVMELIQ